MKNAYILYLLIEYSLTQMIPNMQSNVNETPKSQISHLLWEKKSLGTVNGIYFINQNEIITSSKEGIVSHINITSSEVLYRKFVQNSPRCSSNAKYLLCSYQSNSYGELFNIKTGQLLRTVDMPKNSLSLSSESIVNKSTNLNVLKSNKKIKIFNEKSVLFESKGVEDVHDYYIDQTAKTITFLQGDVLKQLPTVKISKTKVNVIANNTSSSFDNFNTVTGVSRERVFHVKENRVEIFDYNLTKLNEVDLVCNVTKDRVIFFKHNDILVIINEQNASMNVINKQGRINKIKLTYSKFAYSIIDNPKTALLFFASKNAKSIIIVEYDLLSSDLNGKRSEYAITKDANGTLSALSINRNMIGVMFGKTIIIIDSLTKTEVYSYYHEYNLIIFSELIAYSNEMSNSNTDLKYFTSFENIHQKDLSSIISNTVILLTQDIRNVFLSVQETVSKFLEGKSHQKKKINLDSVNSVLQSLFIFTEENELIVLNGLTGNIKFKQTFKGMSLLKIIKPNYKTKILSQTESIIELVFSSDNGRDISIFEYNLLTNTINEKEAIVYKYELQLKQLQLKMIQKNISQLITKEHANLPLEISVGLLKSNYQNKYSIDKEGKFLYCFKYTYTEDKGLIISIVWNIKIEGLLAYNLPTVNENIIPTYLVDGKIFFKYITENIVHTFSLISKKHLLISIIQGQTGKIIKQISIPNIDFSSLQYLYEDNWGLVSYVKIEKGFKRNEIFAIELLKGEIESSLLHLVKKAFKLNSIGNEMQNEIINEDNLSILMKTFILSRHVKLITKSESEFNNANKFIVLLLENNQAFLIDRRSFSPRRPMTKNVKGTPTFDPSLNTPYVDPEFPGYTPVVNLDHKFLLDPNSEGNIDNVALAPSQHESTFILCTIGDNVGCYSVFPDKTFDALSLTFDYNMIGAFLFGCITIVYFIRKYAKRREFTDKFLSTIIN